VNNLHIITLYKLHNKLSCESRLSRSSCRTCRASRARRVERVSSRAIRQARHSLNASARHVVSCRDVTSQVKFGL